jgi:Protein kinase C terminal domain
MNLFHFLSCRVQLSEPARDILRRLLERRVTDRLGSGPTGANELKRSSFFSAYDFAKVAAKGYEAEFIPPPPTSENDVQNFDAEFTSQKPADSLVERHMSGSMSERANFAGFTFQG